VKEKYAEAMINAAVGELVQSGKRAAILGVIRDKIKVIITEATSHGIDEKRESRRCGHHTNMKNAYPMYGNAMDMPRRSWKKNTLIIRGGQ